MKTILVAINSKYSHTNLAVRLLNAYSGYCADVMEFTINEQISFITSQIFKVKPDVICFSTYIWNIETVIKCCEVLKSVLPNTKIILGGPEVSYNAEEILNAHSFIDAIIIGEGEVSFSELINNGFDFKSAHNIAYRDNGCITFTDTARSLSLDELPFPYTDDELISYGQKLLYYETSRGCPYNCSYCLSSTLHSLRFASLDKVKEDLKKFIDKKVRIVKLVDRTFNADQNRAYEIFDFLIKNAGETCFHFEISAHILSDEILKLLETAPKGLFQFEIGVQSTNEKTISAINRKTDFETLRTNVQRLLSFGNIHLHLDLIAGLPYEDIESFKKSFNDVFALNPHMLQLGFLKLLKGTKIREEKVLHGYKFTPYPPYEVLENKYLTHYDILTLKAAEEMVDKLYNNKKFKMSINRLCTFFASPFDMFLALSEYYAENGYDKISISQNALYSFLAEFIKLNADELTLQMLKFDYYHEGRFNTHPDWTDNPSIGKLRFDVIENNRGTIFTIDTPAKEIIKKVMFARFSYDIFTEEKKDCIIAFFKNGEYKILG